MELIKSKIKDIIYKVAPNGRLVAILVLQKKSELVDENDVLKNAILLDNAIVIQTKGLHVGSKLQINTEDLQNPIHKVLNSSQAKPLPDRCPSCGEKLSKHEYTVTRIDEETEEEYEEVVDCFQCTNLFCTGQSQSHLFKFMAYMKPSIDSHLMRKFLDEYVTTGSSHTDIRNITDFDKIYMNIKGRETRTRLNNWIKVHGEYIGDKLFDLDVAIQKELSKEYLPKSMFWFTANLPIRNQELVNRIANINPQHFFEGTDSVFKSFSSTEQKFLLDNFDFLFKLIKLFKAFGDKEWT
ncbi:MAG: hypothetical protein HRU18_01730 [Pseudoalteromonas sp.]|uniref:Mut7-C RNAse domain-containing protein n=1 Tax=Pseudoalteromonas sp. TaxID=53249 RepID=UPI001DB9B5CE|nr:Mut7-C RNAse domain-containing protein [Pseudoalteromonas sp.]NRA76902.1 hypothetical protein [Pseudoalteromonas sp.]